MKIKASDPIDNAEIIARLGVEARNLGLKIRVDFNAKPHFESLSRGLSNAARSQTGRSGLARLD